MLSRIVFILCCFFPAALFAVDIDGDGKDEHFVYSPNDSRVTVHSSDGALLDHIKLNQNFLADNDPILFQGVSNNKAIVFSLTVDAKNSGTLHAISAEGREKKISLGQMNFSSIIVVDIGGRTSSDILWSNKKREVFQMIDPLESGSRAGRVPLRLKKGERISVLAKNGVKTVVTYGTGKKRTRRITLHTPNTKREKLKNFLSKKVLLYPLTGKDGLQEMSYLEEQIKKRANNYQFRDLAQQSKAKLTSTNSLSPGYFIDTTSGAPQFAMSNGRTVSIHEVSSPDTTIATVELDYGDLSSPTAPIGGAPGGGGGGPIFGCDNQYPARDVQEAKAALQRGDFFTFQRMMVDLQSRNYCPEILERIAQELNLTTTFSTRAAKTPNEVLLLGAPVHTTGKDQRKLGGCDKIRGSSDGPGGFVSKDSDHDHNFVVLAPANFYTEKAFLVKPNLKGTVIDKLRFTGRSNGYRPTFRGDRPSNRYPRHLIVKFFVGSSFGGEQQAWCYQLKNSHSRND